MAGCKSCNHTKQGKYPRPCWQGEFPQIFPDGSLLNGGVPCYNVYRTADDRWLAVGALELKFWERLCRALGRPDWAARHWTLGQGISRHGQF